MKSKCCNANIIQDIGCVLYGFYDYDKSLSRFRVIKVNEKSYHLHRDDWENEKLEEGQTIYTGERLINIGNKIFFTEKELKKIFYNIKGVIDLMICISPFPHWIHKLMRI